MTKDTLRMGALVMGALGALASCAATPSNAPETATRAAIAEAPAPLPPAEREANGICRAREITPAVYEHVMGEVQVVQAEIAEDGTVINPPIYRRAPVPRVVQARSEISFEAPCPELLTPEFIASLQRALAARGYFAGNVTGVLDGPTAAAIRKFQAERGLESGQVSLQTARELGLVAVPRDSL